MKLNNNQILFSTIVICFALVGKCVATFQDSPLPSSLLKDVRKTKTTSYPQKPESEASQFSDSPSTVPPSEAPTSPTSENAFGYSSSFSSSFSDYLKGTHRSHSKTKYNHDLEQICGHTHYPDVCLSTISPLLKHKFDVIHVLQAAITICTQRIRMTIAEVEKHAAVSREIAVALADCKDHYSKALEGLHKAMDAIHARKFGIVTIMLSGVMADVSTAESKIEDLKSSSFKVDYYNFVSITTRNCLSIASLIPK